MRKKENRRSGSLFSVSDRTGNFARAQTAGTNVHMAGRTVNDRFHALDVGLPGTIGTAMGVGNLNPESHSLIAKLALCHPLHLLAVIKSSLYQQAFDIITDAKIKSKRNFQKNAKKLFLRSDVRL